MGVVYEAEQLSLGRHVALKVLPPGLFNNPDTAKRFQREAAAAAALHHTNIVPVYEASQDSGTFFYAMQLIRGRSLDVIRAEIKNPRFQAGIETVVLADDTADRNLKATKLRPTDRILESSSWQSSGSTYFQFVADVGRQVASALHYAHERGIVHRDVKPANLILDNDGVVWLADFGLAKQMDDDLTGSADIPGTLRYMSPERFKESWMPRVTFFR